MLFAVRREDGAITGTFVLSQIFYGPFCNAYLGYWATQAYAGQGYMTEGMAGVLRHAFRKLKLHRVEANVQPGNTGVDRAAGTLRIPARGLLPALPQGRRPLARSRALGDHWRRTGAGASH